MNSMNICRKVAKKGPGHALCMTVQALVYAMHGKLNRAVCLHALSLLLGHFAQVQSAPQLHFSPQLHPVLHALQVPGVLAAGFAQVLQVQSACPTRSVRILAVPALPGCTVCSSPLRSKIPAYVGTDSWQNSIGCVVCKFYGREWQAKVHIPAPQEQFSPQLQEVAH